MEIGTKVRIKFGRHQYAGRKGVVVPFDSSLPWKSPRALLCPEKCVCVHLLPKTGHEMRNGSPIVMMFPYELAATSAQDKHE